MTKSQRQHGIGSLAPDEKIVGKPGSIVEHGVKQYGIFKKIKKAAKKVFKSPLGKAAMLGLGAYYMPGIGAKASGGWGPWASRGIGAARNMMMGRPDVVAGKTMGTRSGGLWNWMKGNPGKAAMIGAGVGGTLLPLIAGKGEDDEVEEDNWWETPKSIANIKNMARLQDPSLSFLPKPEYTQSGYYLAGGGLAGLANGGGAAEAQAEQMLKMEYQKYRNQGGTMSYQQFKMAVLQQAQQQGPMAQGQPQMAAQGGRMGYQGGEFVEDASMVEETPAGMMEENVEEVTGEPTREQLEALAMEIFQLRLEELDEKQLMIVYQAAMEQQPQEEMMQEDIEFNPQMAPPAMAAGGGRIGADEGGLMSLGGMEKDYRQDGGFVPLGKKEKADDVPARLSKNEFVFTADAVRNAGGGDIDAGAEVMQNMMENLESGGQISEESQGGGGEEEIFSEEIAEGPNGAQEMYDQQQMLRSRMA